MLRVGARGASSLRRTRNAAHRTSTTTRISNSSTNTTTNSSALVTPLAWPTATTTTTTTSFFTKQAADTVRAFGIGTVAGAVTSMAGMGGALLMIPVLTAAPLRLSQHAAHGTALAAVAATNLSGAWMYRNFLMSSGNTTIQEEEQDASAAADNNNDALLAVVSIALSGMLTARMGARMTTRLDPRTLKRALGSLMLALSAAVPLKEALVTLVDLEQDVAIINKDAVEAGANEAMPKLWQRAVPYLLVGGASGYLAGLFGVGGGTIVVPALTILSSHRGSSSAELTTAAAAATSHHQILATSLLATTLPAIVGTWTHYQAGNVVLRLAPALAAGAASGAVLGGTLGQRTDETTLRHGLTALLAILGTRTLWRSGLPCLKNV